MTLSDKFKMVLESDEEIIWCNSVNVSTYVLKKVLKTLLICLFPPFALAMLGVPYSVVLLILSLLRIIPLWIGVLHFFFSVMVSLIYVSIQYKDGRNTFLCITNERVIKRSGAFNNKFVHYSLKNVGTIEVSGGFLDRKGDIPSANLIITVKDYHTNTDGNGKAQKLDMISLNDAYEAYKILNERTKGNNEVLRIKTE